MTYENPWLYNNEILDSDHIENYVGMVYLLENSVTQKFYVGKKFFWTTKPKMIKGKKKKIRCESDWKKYYGSNKVLQEEIKEIGIDKIRRTVIKLCNTKTQCSYYEMVEQIERQALLKSNYYNEFIGGKINGRFLQELK